MTAAGSSSVEAVRQPTPTLSQHDVEKGQRAAATGQQEASRSSSTSAPSDDGIPLQRWNSPPINMYRTAATFWSFLVVGMNDGSYGVSEGSFRGTTSLYA